MWFSPISKIWEVRWGPTLSVYIGQLAIQSLLTLFNNSASGRYIPLTKNWIASNSKMQKMNRIFSRIENRYFLFQQTKNSSRLIVQREPLFLNWIKIAQILKSWFYSWSENGFFEFLNNTPYNLVLKQVDSKIYEMNLLSLLSR